MLATITSAALQGIDAEPVHVEVNAGEIGEPRIYLVGLPDAAVKESEDRVFPRWATAAFARRARAPRSTSPPATSAKKAPFTIYPSPSVSSSRPNTS